MESLSLTVTELVRACLDEDYRRSLKSGAPPPRKPFVAAGSVPVGGPQFHALAARFLEWLVSSGEAAALAEATDLWPALYSRFAARELVSLCEAGRIETALNLAKALEAFCGRIAGLRRAARPEAAWREIFLAQEYPLKDVPFRFGDKAVFVSGVMDAIRLNPEKGLEVADYKLSRGANAEQDLLQVAVYARLLRERNPGVAFRAVVEYYSPAFEALEVAPDDLDRIFRQMAEPVLRELAGAAASPGSGQGGGNPLTPAPDPQTPPPAYPEPDLSQAIAECFGSFKLGVTPSGRVEGPQIVRYIFRPAPGVRVVSLANRAEDLQVALRLPHAPRIEPASAGVTVDIPRQNPVTVRWADVIGKCPAGPLAFPIGVGVDGSVVSADLSESSCCHALVGGMSGSGKSEWLKSLTASLIARSGPDTVRIALVDPKFLTFTQLGGASHLLRPVITDLAGALEFLEEAVTEMDRRYKLLAGAGVSNLAEMRAQGRRDLPFWVVIFDEFADLILAGKDQKKRFEETVARLAGKGRAAGIHLVLATQRPDRNVVTGLIKANLPLKICLQVANAVNSQIVLDEPGAERLLGRGDLLFDKGRGVHRAQGPFIPGGELAALARRL